MAKRQQQQDFLPTKAIQPQQQITDNFIATNPASVNQSELVEIGQALAGLSPTLQKFEERDRAEDAARMELVAGKMSLEELRAASKRDFIGLQKKGVIREGESPWAKVALLEAAGKRLVSQTVVPELYKNLDRLSDPNNNETPETFARTILEEQGIDSLYAANAAEQAMQPVIAQFTNRVSESKAARTAKQNRDDLTDSLYAKFQTFDKSAPPSEREAFVKTIKDELDKAHSDLGISGRNEAWNALSSAAEEMTRNGDYEGALELLESVETMKIGDKEFGFDFADKRDKLEDDLDDINARVETDEYNEETRRLTTNTRAAKTVANTLYQELIKTKEHFTDPTKLQDKIQEKLKEQGVAAEDILAVTTEAMTHLKSVQSSGLRNDEDTVTTISKMIIEGASYEAIETTLDAALAANQITGDKYISLKIAAEKETDVSSTISTVVSRDRKGNRVRNRLERKLFSVDSFGERQFSDVEAERILDEWEEAYGETVRSVVTDPANADLDDDQLIRKVNEAQKAIDEQYLNPLSEGITQEVPEDAPESVQEVVQRQRLGALEGEKTPEILTVPATSIWVDESDFHHAQVKYQNETDEKEKAKLSGEIYELAKERAASVPKPREVGPQDNLAYYGTPSSKVRTPYMQFPMVIQPEPKAIADYTRAKAIVGLSIDEITNRKLEGDFDIPEEMLNPKFVVLIEGMENAQQFRQFTEDPQNTDKLNQIYDALPDNFKVGYENFIKVQFNLLKRLR